jgi:TRAP-type C4-dicarboxylate transport system permease large subunit
MAFYKAKDGRVGGVYSDNYAGGSLGNLNAFPYIQLSGPFIGVLIGVLLLITYVPAVPLALVNLFYR